MALGDMLMIVLEYSRARIDLTQFAFPQERPAELVPKGLAQLSKSCKILCDSASNVARSNQAGIASFSTTPMSSSAATTLPHRHVVNR